MISNIQLNNARGILEKLQECDSDDLEKHLVMVERSTFMAVKITDENIHNNSNFILNLWDE